MKLIHMADLHLGRPLKALFGTSYTSKRLEQQRRVLEELLEKLKPLNPDLAVISGDLMDSATPSIEAEELALWFLRELGNIAPVIVIPGNHDSFKRFRLYNPLMEPYNVLMLSPELERFPESMIVHLNDVGIIAVPFISPSKLKPLKVFQELEWKPEEAAMSYSKLMARVLKALEDELRRRNYNYSIALAHVFVEGSELAGSEINVADWSVMANDLPRVNYVALGHVHVPQTVTKDVTLAIYSGSPWELTFGDGRVLTFKNGELSEERAPISRGVKVVTLYRDASPQVEHLPLDSPEFITVKVRVRDLDNALKLLEAEFSEEKAWFRLSVLDEELSIPQMEDIVAKVPNVLRIESQKFSTRVAATIRDESEQDLFLASPVNAYIAYHEDRYGSSPSEESIELLKKILSELQL